ncbi:MAG TPA: GTP cyclohydrolase I FolE [Longimicrobiales bacterium]
MIMPGEAVRGSGARVGGKAEARAPTVSRRPVDVARMERGIRELLLGLGEDPDREGLQETPARVARAYRELLGGSWQEPGEHLERVFAQEHAGDDVVMLRGIRFVSVCEHHLLPFTGVAHVAYLPSHGRVTGLSKLARTVDVYARRLQMQERLTAQVADALVEHLDPRGVAVVVESEHSCLRLRGAQKEDASMVTTAFRGALEHDRALRAEVLGLMGIGR